MEDWQSIIARLEAEQAKLTPGNGRILDITSVIQAIRAQVLDENFGHARYFANTPGAKNRVWESIKDMVAEVLPEHSAPGK